MVVHEAGSSKVKGVDKPTSATTSAAKALAKLKFPPDRLINRVNREAIPHNKFIVHLDGNGDPRSVLTGSANFTESGFLGQGNVTHVVHDSRVAAPPPDAHRVLRVLPEPLSGRDPSVREDVSALYQKLMAAIEDEAGDRRTPFLI